MIEIKGIRGSGKTTTLLYLAHGSGAVIVEPTHAMADFVKKEAKKLGLTDVAVISMHEFLNSATSICSRKVGEISGNNKFMIDELDAFLANLHVEGYTLTV